MFGADTIQKWVTVTLAPAWLESAGLIDEAQDMRRGESSALEAAERAVKSAATGFPQHPIVPAENPDTGGIFETVIHSFVDDAARRTSQRHELTSYAWSETATCAWNVAWQAARLTAPVKLMAPGGLWPGAHQFLAVSGRTCPP